MVLRLCLPNELYLEAAMIDPFRALDRFVPDLEEDWIRPIRHDDATLVRARERGRHIALRWVLNSALGIPLEPFTVWRRPADRREPMVPIPNWHKQGTDTFWWDGLTEMIRIEIDVNSAVTAWGLSRNDNGAVIAVNGGPGKIVLEGAPMVGVRLSNPGAVTAARGLSVMTMANGTGWTSIERVGLPIPSDLEDASYYNPDYQGLPSAPTDPVSAAIERIKRWGPVTGWTPLGGLPPWMPPDPERLVDEFVADLIPDLVAVLAANPPPALDAQATAKRPPRPLPALQQMVAGQPYSFGAAGHIERSEMVTRPLQVLATGVASDCWSSLALGFGTGAELGDTSGRMALLDDFMVTAPWRGLMKVAVHRPWPWPWNAPPPEFVDKEVERELCTIALSPNLRAAPDRPSPLLPAPTHVEGALVPDAPFTNAVKIETPRSTLVPNRARASGYGLARFDKPGVGDYRLRERLRAGGWIPIGSAAPVIRPETPADPALTPGAVMLRDSGVPRPLTGAALNYQYAVAATDLFGQWGDWGTAWLALGPADPQIPAVTVARAKAAAGAAGADPCPTTVTAEIVWDASERTCNRMDIRVDIFDPYPAPPAPLGLPPEQPQTLPTANVVVAFDGGGMPLAVPPGATVTPLHPDDRPVTVAAPFATDERRYRVVLSDIPVVFGAAREKAAAVYACAEETVGPGQWSGWGHAHEMVIIPNPKPPPVLQPLPPQFPVWASLPDAAGLSHAPVEWPPSGAWGYRVYEASETALLGACGEAGPVLTRSLGDRMQALFDLYANPGNHQRLKAAYRKLGDAPIVPPLQSNGLMRYEALLPRGSSLIHCFVVVGVSEANMVSAWPIPDAEGRKGFLAFAIPEHSQPPMPEIRARIGVAGHPEVIVEMGGSIPVTSLRLYRAVRPVLARHAGTMELVATIAPDAADWRTTVIADPGAPQGWEQLHYRVVAMGEDEPAFARMAIDSPASRDYPLLFPPADPPSLALVELASRRSLTGAVVRVITDAPRRTVAIGNHHLAWILRNGSLPAQRGASALPDVPEFESLDTWLATSAPVAFVAGQTYLQLARQAGEALALRVELADPLGRASRALLDLPVFVPDPVPQITTLSVVRQTFLPNRGVWIGIDSNAPATIDPAQDWTLTVRYRRTDLFLGGMTTRSFPVSTIPVVPDAESVPTPSEVPDQWLVRRIDGTGQFVMWVRLQVRLSVTVVLTNSAGQSVTRQATSS